MKFKEWWNSPEGIVLVNRIIMVVLGLFMIGMGIAGVIMTLKEPLIEVEGGFILMTVYAYSGVVIILSTNRSPRFIIFLAGVTFAALNMIQHAVIFYMESPPSSLLFIIMDFVMIMSCILCLLGDRYSALRLLGVTAINLVTTYTAQISQVLEITTYSIGYTTFWWMIVECLFLITYMVLLLRPGIRDDSVKSRIRKGIEVLDSMMMSSPSVFIDEKDMPALIGADRSGWVQKEDAGPIESECVTEVHDGNRMALLTSSKWRGEEDIRISIVPNINDRPYGYGFVLRAHSVEELEGSRYLRLYGDDGFYLRILLKSDYDTEQGPSEEMNPDQDPVVYVGDKIMTG